MSNGTVSARPIFEQMWNHKKTELIDQLVDNHYRNHDPQSPNFVEGIDAYKSFVSHYLAAFPDIHFTVDDEISCGDTSVTRWTVTGTHKGDLPMLPATGRRISLTGITIAKWKNGKVVEAWNNWDALGMMQQLGGAPTGQAA